MSVAPRGDAGVCAWPSPGLCNQARGRGGGVAAWASSAVGLRDAWWMAGLRQKDQQGRKGEWSA